MQQPTAKDFYYVIYLFTIGLFLGILVVNLGYDTWVADGKLLGVDMVARLKNSVPDPGSLLGYVLKHRLFTVCMIGLLATTVIGLPAVCGYICYVGLSAGCLLSVAVIRYGIRGILLMMAGILPQGLLLIPAYATLFVWAIGVNRMMYSRSPYKEYYIRSGRRFYVQKGLQMAGIFAVVIMGSLIESYVNPKVLHMILNIF